MAKKMVDLRDAREHLAELIEQVDAGAEIILTEGPRPRARLVPLQSPPARRVPGLHPGSMTASDDFDAPLPEDVFPGTA